MNRSRANILFRKWTSLLSQSHSSSGSHCYNTQANQSILENTDFLGKLAGQLLPTLRRIISSDEQRGESQKLTQLNEIIKEVCETSLETYRTVLKMQKSLPMQVEDQKPVYFTDACAFAARIDLTWINSWEAFLAVLGVRFKQRGLQIVEKKQYVLEDASSKIVIDSRKSFESCFFPGRQVNMDALFNAKEHSTNCCPVCRYGEPSAVADQPVDWYAHQLCSNHAADAFLSSKCGTHYRRIEEVIERAVKEIEPPKRSSRKRKASHDPVDIISNSEDKSPDDDFSQFRRIRLLSQKFVLSRQNKSRSKGPVYVEVQCGVLLPDGTQCARSLTCKRHSIGAKRAVPGRSLPYDVLLAQFPKKDQTRASFYPVDTIPISAAAIPIYPPPPERPLLSSFPKPASLDTYYRSMGDHGMANQWAAQASLPPSVALPSQDYPAPVMYQQPSPTALTNGIAPGSQPCVQAATMPISIVPTPSTDAPADRVLKPRPTTYPATELGRLPISAQESFPLLPLTEPSPSLVSLEEPRKGHGRLTRKELEDQWRQIEPRTQSLMSEEVAQGAQLPSAPSIAGRRKVTLLSSWASQVLTKQARPSQGDVVLLNFMLEFNQPEVARQAGEGGPKYSISESDLTSQ